MISTYLKEQTRPLHDRVEEKFNSPKIFDKTFTVADYRQFLRYNYQFFQVFEDAVFEAILPGTAADLNLERRRKLPLLERDLAQCGVEVNGLSFEKATLKNEAEALGILYVMEGATLGGNVIARQLAKQPEFQGVDFSYFSCYGEETGPLWKRFLEVLNTKIEGQTEQDCVSGAEKAYTFLLTCTP